MARPKITMTLLVRNEEDIIAENIRFHHALGVDSFIVMDNLSTDATPDIIKELSREIDIDYLRQSQDDYNQWEWVTELARAAAVDHNADWVINNDADELWIPQAGDLKTFLSGLSSQTGSVLVTRHNAVVISEAGKPLCGRSHPKTTDIFELESTNNLGVPLPGKMLHRASEVVTVAQGNHSVSEVPGQTEAAEGRIRILHYPYRSLNHYKAKIRLGGAAYVRNTTLPQDVGATWRAHYEGLGVGSVEQFWTDLTHTPEEVDIGTFSGQLVRDGSAVAYFAASERDRRQKQVQVATGELVDRTKAMVEDFGKSLATLIGRIPRRQRPDRPMYYNLRFATNSAETHLRKLQEIPAQVDPNALCANLAELRDVFSLFPRNGHMRTFLSELLQITHEPAVTRLRKDCKNKRVVLHTSCLSRLPASEETVTSFNGLRDGYHHIILLGEETTHGENETPLSLSYDGRFLRVPTPDSYESLHRKLFYAYMLFDLVTQPELLIKIDDNIMLTSAPDFEACIDVVAEHGAVYAGRKVGGALHESQWHGWHLTKCADPVLETRGYQYPLPRDYAAGGHGYVLGPKGLSACCYMYLAMKEFFSVRSVGLEDACVGHAMYAQGLELLDLSREDNLLALPGLTTKEKWRLQEAEKKI